MSGIGGEKMFFFSVEDLPVEVKDVSGLPQGLHGHHVVHRDADEDCSAGCCDEEPRRWSLDTCRLSSAWPSSSARNFFRSSRWPSGG